MEIETESKFHLNISSDPVYRFQLPFTVSGNLCEAICYLEDHNLLAIGNRSGQLYTLDLKTLKVSKTIKLSAYSINSLTYVQDKQILLVESARGICIIAEVPSLRKLRQMRLSKGYTPLFVNYIPNQKVILVNDFDHLNFYELNKDELLCSISLQDIISHKYIESEDKIVVATIRSLHVFDAKTRSQLFKWEMPGVKHVKAITNFPKSNIIALLIVHSEMVTDVSIQQLNPNGELSQLHLLKHEHCDAIRHVSNSDILLTQTFGSIERYKLSTGIHTESIEIPINFTTRDILNGIAVLGESNIIAVGNAGQALITFVKIEPLEGRKNPVKALEEKIEVLQIKENLLF
jgi:hypothetical protein